MNIDMDMDTGHGHVACKALGSPHVKVEPFLWLTVGVPHSRASVHNTHTA